MGVCLLPCPVIIRHNSSSRRLEQIQRLTTSCYLERNSKLVSFWTLPLKIRKPSKRMGGKTVGVKGDEGNKENMAHQYNLLGLTWAHREWSINHGACMGLYQVLSAYVMADSLAFSVGLLTVIEGTSLTLLPAFITLFLLEFPCPALSRRIFVC